MASERHHVIRATNRFLERHHVSVPILAFADGSLIAGTFNLEWTTQAPSVYLTGLTLLVVGNALALGVIKLTEYVHPNEPLI